MKLIDITGKKYKKLTVLGIGKRKQMKNGDTRIYWKCLCDCGKITYSLKFDLISGKKGSCGCLLVGYIKHGLSSTKFYRVWSAMKDRCLRKTDKNYKNYGGRGISIDKKWEEFKKFKDDMYASYLLHQKKFGARNTTLDRENNNKGYSKKNCRWATYKEQSRNTRGNRYFNYSGEEILLIDLAKKLGILPSAVLSRVKRTGSFYAI